MAITSTAPREHPYDGHNMPGTSVGTHSFKRGASAERKEAARLEALAGEDESYDEYVPLRERRRREAERRSGKLGKNRRDKERELLERERWAGPCVRNGDNKKTMTGGGVVLSFRVRRLARSSVQRVVLLACFTLQFWL